MTKKAIDVVLLPSEDMMDKAIAINRELLQRGEPKKMVLNKTDCLPHISILMGCVADTDFPAVIGQLNNIASHYPEFHLQVADVQQEGGSTVLNMQPDGRLQQLHEATVEQLSPLFTYDASAAMLYNPEEVRQNSSIDYINHFLNNASYSKYSPHITVGSGAYQLTHLPVPFTAGTLAICHLGNHCTCRNILYQVQLRIE
jgi:2'-5' RNA ligase